MPECRDWRRRKIRWSRRRDATLSPPARDRRWNSRARGRAPELHPHVPPELRFALSSSSVLLRASGAHHAVAAGVHPEYDPALRDPDQRMQPHPDHREDDQDREGAGHVEIEVLLQDEIAEPCLGADELADDGANHRQHDGDVEPDEDVGQRLQQAHHTEHLPARRGIGDHHLDLVVRRGAQSHDGVGKQWEERDGRSDHDLGCNPVAEPDHDDRCDRDLGNGLEGDDIGIEDPFHQRRERDDEAQHQAAGRADHKTGHDLVQRDREMPLQIARLEALPHCHRDLRGRRQHDLRDAEEAYRPFPAADEDEEHGRLQQYVAGRAIECPWSVGPHVHIGCAHAACAHVPCTHASRLPSDRKCRRMAATKRPNSGVLCMAKVRGRGRSTLITSTIRPGRGVMTTTRSAR